jgi:hypothetical protein
VHEGNMPPGAAARRAAARRRWRAPRIDVAS